MFGLVGEFKVMVCVCARPVMDWWSVQCTHCLCPMYARDRHQHTSCCVSDSFGNPKRWLSACTNGACQCGIWFVEKGHSLLWQEELLQCIGEPQHNYSVWACFWWPHQAHAGNSVYEWGPLLWHQAAWDVGWWCLNHTQCMVMQCRVK